MRILSTDFQLTARMIVFQSRRHNAIAVRAAKSMLFTAHNQIRQIQNYVLRTKLKEEFRGWRRPIVQAVAENVLREQRSGGRQAGFNGDWLDDAEIGA